VLALALYVAAVVSAARGRGVVIKVGLVLQQVYLPGKHHTN
jgi:hypothetical protein